VVVYVRSRNANVLDRVDDRVLSGLSFVRTIGEGRDGKITALKAQHEAESAELKKRSYSHSMLLGSWEDYLCLVPAH
jgi:hypothetical protein